MTNLPTRPSAPPFPAIISKGDIPTLAAMYVQDAIRVTPAQAFCGRSAIEKDWTETNKIFSNIVIKTNKVESSQNGTSFCDGEWSGNMKTQDGQTAQVKGPVTGEIQGGKFMHLMRV